MNPTLAQRVLKFMYPKSEAERLHFRLVLAQARAEAEDLTIVLSTCKPKKPNGNGSGK